MKTIARAIVILALFFAMVRIGFDPYYNRKLIQRTNQSMAHMFDELRKDKPPCDLMGFEFKPVED